MPRTVVIAGQILPPDDAADRGEHEYLGPDAVADE